MEIKECENALLTLIRAGLSGNIQRLSEEFSDWNQLVALAKKQAMLGIIAKVILSDRAYSSMIPNELRLKLKSFVVSCVMISNNMTDTIHKIFAALNEAGLRPVLLKGHGLASYYPNPELRQCGDIDIYVGEDDAQAAHAVLASIATDIDPVESARWGKHFVARFSDIEVEIHRHTSGHALGKYDKFYRNAAHKGFATGLQLLTIGEGTVATPSVEFNAYYIFDHLFDHFLNSGIGLRHLCDLMMFLRHYKGRIDLDELRYLLVKMDMLEPWQVFGDILVKYLGFDKDDFPFYQESSKTDKVLEYILHDGNFGKETAYYIRRSNNYLLTKANAFYCHIIRGTRMLSLFPKHAFRHFIYVLSNYFLHLREDIKYKFRHGR